MIKAKPMTAEEKLRAQHRLMMTLGRGVDVIVHSDTGNTSRGQVRVREWDKAARVRRATKFWLYSWGLALISVLIPLAHFVLVPAFLLAGPLGAWLLSTQATAILIGESTCPDCGAFLPLAPAGDKWPLRDLCTGCHRRMRVEKVT